MRLWDRPQIPERQFHIQQVAGALNIPGRAGPHITFKNLNMFPQIMIAYKYLEWHDI
jgi:hypothetical protein